MFFLQNENCCMKLNEILNAETKLKKTMFELNECKFEEVILICLLI